MKGGKEKRERGGKVEGGREERGEMEGQRGESMHSEKK